MNSLLFNCCTNNEAPDWSQFDGLEVGGCIDCDGYTEGGQSDADAQFWTVYGHLIGGGVEAITDCASRDLVDRVAQTLSELSGLPITHA